MKSHVETSSLSTLKIGGFASSLTALNNLEDVMNFLKIPGRKMIVGEGSNVVFSDKFLPLDIGKMGIKGIEKINEDGDKVLVKAGAGENWDGFVNWTVENNFSGLEALSGIPGTVGASPIQNIGAYGKEVGGSIDYIETYDTAKREFSLIDSRSAAFSYRDSIFKRNPGRWIVVSVIFKFNKNKKPSVPDYRDVKTYFDSRSIFTPTLTEIRKAIIEIRSNKLPDPETIPNCGSFFKNPFISGSQADKIKKVFPAVPIFEQNGLFKIPAGFLIESCGFKGKVIRNIAVYENNALVLTNTNNAKFSDLIYAKNKIQKTVFQKFGINLEPEVNIIE